MAFMRTGQVKFYHDWCNFDPLATNNLFLLRFALSGPGKLTAPRDLPSSVSVLQRSYATR